MQGKFVIQFTKNNHQADSYRSEMYQARVRNPNLVLLFNFISVELGTYLTRFQWDMAKYPIKQSLRNISDIIAKVIGGFCSRLHQFAVI